MLRIFFFQHLLLYLMKFTWVFNTLCGSMLISCSKVCVRVNIEKKVFLTLFIWSNTLPLSSIFSEYSLVFTINYRLVNGIDAYIHSNKSQNFFGHVQSLLLCSKCKLEVSHYSEDQWLNVLNKDVMSNSLVWLLLVQCE